MPTLSIKQTTVTSLSEKICNPTKPNLLETKPNEDFVPLENKEP